MNIIHICKSVLDIFSILNIFRMRADDVLKHSEFESSMWDHLISAARRRDAKLSGFAKILWKINSDRDDDHDQVVW